MTERAAERMKLHRTQLGITQQELSELSGISQQAISRYERGEILPRAEAAVKIAQVLKVTVDYLMGVTDEPTNEAKTSDLSPDEIRMIQLKRSKEWALLFYELAGQMERENAKK